MANHKKKQLIRRAREAEAEVERLQGECNATADTLAAVLGVDPCPDGPICHANNVAIEMRRLLAEVDGLKRRLASNNMRCDGFAAEALRLSGEVERLRKMWANRVYGDDEAIAEVARRNWARAVAPRPGTTEAIALGCTCPVTDNAYGAGHMGNGERYGWMYNRDCVVHGA